MTMLTVMIISFGIVQGVINLQGLELIAPYCFDVILLTVQAKTSRFNGFPCSGYFATISMKPDEGDGETRKSFSIEEMSICKLFTVNEDDRVDFKM